MTTLTDFLLARIAEDEAAANRGWNLASSRFGLIDLSEYADVLVADPSHVMAECAAKRQIVDYYDRWTNPTDGHILAQDERMVSASFQHVLRILATPYADHPDYQEEWAL